MLTNQSSPETTTAKSPFDDLDADIIIRSSDNIDFRVFKSMLSLASPFFKDMFKLPQTTDSDSHDIQGNDQVYKDGFPVIVMYDDKNEAYKSEVVEKLLIFCHPACVPEPGDAGVLAEAAGAAAKYQMEGVARMMLKYLVKSRPLMVFAFACHFGLVEEAKVAARHTLRMRTVDFPREPMLKMITAWQYHRLLEFHRRCGKDTSEVARGERFGNFEPHFSWITSQIGKSVLFLHLKGIESCETGGQRITTGADDATLSPRIWWTEYMEQAASELELRPSAETVMSHELMDRALRSASKCKFCREKVFTRMRAFTNVFKAEVEGVISRVSFSFP
jgi:hypothetical protein